MNRGDCRFSAQAFCFVFYPVSPVLYHGPRRLLVHCRVVQHLLCNITVAQAILAAVPSAGASRRPVPAQAILAPARDLGEQPSDLARFGWLDFPTNESPIA